MVVPASSLPPFDASISNCCDVSSAVALSAPWPRAASTVRVRRAMSTPYQPSSLPYTPISPTGIICTYVPVQSHHHVTLRRPDGATPLLGACLYNRLSVVQLLLAKKADANLATSDDGIIKACCGLPSLSPHIAGTTPLFVASEDGYIEALSHMLQAT